MSNSTTIFTSPTMELTKEGEVHVLTLNNTESANTFTDSVILEHLNILDKLEAIEGNTSIVVTSSDPKAWSTGINLEWLTEKGPEYFSSLKTSLDAMFLRWVRLPMPTIACLTGHTFAGGAILSCCFDFRLMRKDRGYFCFSEVDVKIPFSPTMHAVIEQISDKRALKEIALTGRRIGGEDAVRMSVVDATYDQADLLPKTMELAAMLATKDRATYSLIKAGLKADLYAI